MQNINKNQRLNILSTVDPISTSHKTKVSNNPISIWKVPVQLDNLPAIARFFNRDCCYKFITTTFSQTDRQQTDISS